MMVHLTLFAKSDLAYRQQHGMKALKKEILLHITSEAMPKVPP